MTSFLLNTVWTADCYLQTPTVFCYNIKTVDVYSAMHSFSDDLDTSSYPRDTAHDALKTLYSSKNANVVGKFKVECNGTAPLEFVVLRSKMYSLLVSSHVSKITSQGIKSHTSKST